MEKTKIDGDLDISGGILRSAFQFTSMQLNMKT